MNGFTNLKKEEKKKNPKFNRYSNNNKDNLFGPSINIIHLKNLKLKNNLNASSRYNKNNMNNKLNLFTEDRQIYNKNKLRKNKLIYGQARLIQKSNLINNNSIKILINKKIRHNNYDYSNNLPYINNNLNIKSINFLNPNEKRLDFKKDIDKIIQENINKHKNMTPLIIKNNVNFPYLRPIKIQENKNIKINTNSYQINLFNKDINIVGNNNLAKEKKGGRFISLIKNNDILFDIRKNNYRKANKSYIYPKEESIPVEVALEINKREEDKKFEKILKNLNDNNKNNNSNNLDISSKYSDNEQEHSNGTLSNLINEGIIESDNDDYSEYNNPLDEEIIDSFPIVKLSGLEKLPDDLNRCVICLDDFQENDEILSLPCVHIYHAECIKEWLRKRNTCPICKLEIPNLNEDN